jgi:hypothetical protein
MAYARMIGEGLGEERLRSAAVSAPGAAELDDRRPCERVDLGPRWFGWRMSVVHR